MSVTSLSAVTPTQLAHASVRILFMIFHHLPAQTRESSSFLLSSRRSSSFFLFFRCKDTNIFCARPRLPWLAGLAVVAPHRLCRQVGPYICEANLRRHLLKLGFSRPLARAACTVCRAIGSGCPPRGSSVQPNQNTSWQQLAARSCAFGCCSSAYSVENAWRG